MNKQMTALLAASSIVAMLAATPAEAEDVAAPPIRRDIPAATTPRDNSEIVVTGTLIRGTQAVGAQTISVDQTTIAEKGSGTTNELLGTIPQLVSTFNGRFEIDPRGFSTGTNSIN